MARINALISVLAVFAIVGCSKKPADADIDMGPQGAASAASTAQQGPDLTPVIAGRELTPVPVGEGHTARVIETCNVEQVNGQAFADSPVMVSKDAPVAVSGWVVDGTAPGSAELRLVNVADASTHAVAISADVPREDVAKSFQADPATFKPGFNVVFNAGTLTAGDYRMHIVVASSDRGAAACDNGRVISVAN